MPYPIKSAKAQFADDCDSTGAFDHTRIWEQCQLAHCLKSNLHDLQRIRKHHLRRTYMIHENLDTSYIAYKFKLYNALLNVHVHKYFHKQMNSISMLHVLYKVQCHVVIPTYMYTCTQV